MDTTRRLRTAATAAVAVFAVSTLSGCYRFFHPRFITAEGQAVVARGPGGPPPMAPPPPPPPQPFNYPPVRAIGQGAVPPNLVGQPNARPMARRGALLDAERNLLEQVKGVQLSSSTSVRDFITQYDEINSSVQGMIKGARVVNEGFLEPGLYQVEVEVNLADISPLFERYAQRSQPPPQPSRVAVVPGPGPGGAQAELMAYRGARLEATRNFLESIQGTRFSFFKTYGDFLRTSETMRQNVAGVVSSSEVVEQHLENGGSVAHVTIRVDMEAVRRAMRGHPF
jgi:hypothetical protein